MKCFFIPVGKMFFEGAPRLAQSGASLPAHGIKGDGRTVLEVYPALAAMAFAGSRSYKSDSAKGIRSSHRLNREKIVAAHKNENRYGISVTGLEEHDLIDDPGADRLDAVLCALQAAWASQQTNFGIPAEVDTIEGWIVDPSNPGNN
jgi:hypothetical protein